MAKNKSSVYGSYGGVTQSNHYVPPGSPGFVPQPSRINFTEEDKQKVSQLISQTTFYAENAPNILVRKLVSSVPNSSDDIDTFVMTTSAKPDDVIIYTSETNEVNLNQVDAGFF
jgi:hypothetical protein